MENNGFFGRFSSSIFFIATNFICAHIENGTNVFGGFFRFHLAVLNTIYKQRSKPYYYVKLNLNYKRLT